LSKQRSMKQKARISLKSLPNDKLQSTIKDDGESFIENQKEATIAESHGAGLTSKEISLFIEHDKTEGLPPDPDIDIQDHIKREKKLVMKAFIKMPKERGRLK